MHHVDEWIWWVLLQKTPQLGPLRVLRLRETFSGDLEAVWNAPKTRLAAIVGEPAAAHLVKTRTDIDVTNIVRQITTSGQTVICYPDSRYPALLRETDAPPLVLYLLGELDPADDLSIAVIGSRQATPYGREVARTIAGELAAGGVTIVSGLARGIDGVAHEAALAAGGRTIAVLAGGLDLIYPSEHRDLARRICDRGALLSEHWPGTASKRQHFPTRNRIMAGISVGVVITEARMKSGTLITANFATHYNREVFAVPGSILAPSSAGCHQLIREGAALVTSATDILRELQFDEPAPVAPKPISLEPETPGERGLLALLGDEPRHIDDLALELDRPIYDVATTLMMLELQGRVRNTGAQCYARIR